MRWASIIMAGLVAGATAWLALFGRHPDRWGLVCLGAGLVFGYVVLIIKLEQEDR